MPVKVNPWDVGVKPRITRHKRRSGWVMYRCEGQGVGGAGITAMQAYEYWQRGRLVQRMSHVQAIHVKPIHWPEVNSDALVTASLLAGTDYGSWLDHNPFFKTI